jgi:LacI family gluconate utilization system Gnt-I transcriptional repressor
MPRARIASRILASALASSRTRVVAAIVPTLMNSVYASTVHGLSEVLRPAGYELMLGDSGYDPAIEAALVRSFLGRRVDVRVLTGVEHDPATLALLGRHRLPVVEIRDLAERPIDLLVGCSNVAAGREAGRFLTARGRRRRGRPAPSIPPGSPGRPPGPPCPISGGPVGGRPGGAGPRRRPPRSGRSL